MFSIAAINDTDSKSQWEPLAPTKEAQEFHISQIYHEGLAKLQAKDYEKARDLLESILKDPLVSNIQVDNNGIDGHLLQLRFLALKNLATIFLQQGSMFYDNALRCYLQAVEIDAKDSVIWNQLGTLSCSMGLLSISRWAFEQGLTCSPNNWNCMEKLLEVLIAIGDEVACLSVAELILRHWPSHSRALHVKNTIQESDPTPFAPRGIDRLEPRHVRLKFPEKRKETNNDLINGVPQKKLKQNIEVNLPEASWTALAVELLHILTPLVSAGPELEREKFRSRDVSIRIQLPQTSGNITGTREHKVSVSTTDSQIMPIENSEKNSLNKEKEANVFEEQPQERRSSRLERLRSRKPGREDSDFAATKDVTKVILQFLKPFSAEGGGNCMTDSSSSSHCAEVLVRSQDSECNNVIRFVHKTSKNFGAYHMGHMLLEEVANRGICYQDSNVKLLDLEKLTRHWGKERTPECSLFLAELYYDFGICTSGAHIPEFISEASYHVCKVIESVSLEYPFQGLGVAGNDNFSWKESSSTSQISRANSFPLISNHSFWVRFYWLSGHLSIIDGDKEKAREEFSVSYNLLMNNKTRNDSPGSICLPHCKATKKLTGDRILHEINLLEVDFLLKKAVPEMMGKNMYSECVNMLVPLLFSLKDVHLDIMNGAGAEEGFTSVELSAIEVLIKACEEVDSFDSEVYLNCHKRKLQILITAAGLGDYPYSSKREGLKNFSSSEPESRDNWCENWNHMVAQEVKAISECASRIKSNILSGWQKGVLVPASVIGDVLTLICNIANTCFSKKSSGLGNSEHDDKGEQCNFIDAAIVFCKLQHLNPTVPIKTQTKMIVAMDDMLAEFGLCCAHGSNDTEEGTFLKLAIKHLLALHMKLKSNFQTLNEAPEKLQVDQQPLPENNVKRSEQISDAMFLEEQKFQMLKAEVDRVDLDMACTEVKDDVGRTSFQKTFPITMIQRKRKMEWNMRKMSMASLTVLPVTKKGKSKLT